MNKKVISIIVLAFCTVLVIGVTNASSTSAGYVATYSEGGIDYMLYETNGVCTATAVWDKESAEVTIEATVDYDGKTYAVNTVEKFGDNGIVTKVVFKPNTNLKLSTDLLYYSRALTSIELGAGITDLPKGFASTTEIESINLDGVKSIGEGAFSACRNLKSVDLSNVETIGNNAFQMTGITTVQWGNNLKSIGTYAFSECPFEGKVTIPASLVNFKFSSFPYNGVTEFEVNPDNPKFSSKDGILYDKDQTMIVRYPSARTGEIVISANVGEGAFFTTNVSKVSFDTSKSGYVLGIYAFRGCSQLVSVDLNGVKTMSNEVFMYCSQLVSVDLGDLESLPQSAFEGCSQLKSVDISKVKSISNYVFRNCTNLSTISLGPNLERLGNAFGGCESITGKFIIPASLVNIPTNSQSVISLFPSNISEFEVNPDNPKYSSKDGLLCDKELTTILRCPEGKTGDLVISMDIAKFAFGACRLSKVTILDGVSVGANAFNTPFYLNKEYFLTEVVLPTSLTAIGDSAFGGQKKLAQINLENIQIIGNSAFSQCAISYADLSKTTSIGNSAFLNCSSLTEVHLPKKLDLLGNSAFGGTSISSIVMPEVESLGTSVFNLSGLVEVTFIAENKSVTDSMFSGCANLKSVNLCNVQAIGNAAFQNCTSLETISIPESVKTIGNSAFSGCTSLTSCNLSPNLERLGKDVFENTNISGKMVIPASLSTILLYSSAAATFPATLTEIEVDPDNPSYASKDGLLYDKRMTTMLYCPGGRTGELSVSESIGEYAFIDTHLSKIILLEGVKTIGDCAFYKGMMSEIVFPHSLQSIGSNAFSYTVNLERLVLPSELESLGALSIKDTSIKYIEFPSAPFIVSGAKLFTSFSFYLSDGSKVKANLGETVDYLCGARFVLEDAKTFRQISENQVLLDIHIGDESKYTAIPKNSQYSPTIPDAPEYMEFDNWYTDPQFINVYDSTAPLTKDISLYAHFQYEAHTVTYIVDGEVVGEDTYRYGDTVTVRDIYLKTGYTVGDWQSDDLVLVDGTFILGEFDVVFTATSKINQYTISFDTAGGTDIASITQDYLSVITVPSEIPVRDGYVFAGWSQEIPETMPAYDLVIKAVWAIAVTPSDDGKSEVNLDSETDRFVPSEDTEEITVRIDENTSIRIVDASDLAGKMVLSKVEPTVNTSGQTGSAFEFTFTADGTAYTGKMQVTLPYSTVDGKVPAVYYWDGATLVKMNILSHTDSTVTFETSHNSVYILTSEDKSSADNPLVYVAVIALAIVLVAAAITVYRRKA